MLQLVVTICRQNSYVYYWVTHQLSEVITIMQRVIRIDNGRITENYLVQRHNNR